MSPAGNAAAVFFGFHYHSHLSSEVSGALILLIFQGKKIAMKSSQSDITPEEKEKIANQLWEAAQIRNREIKKRHALVQQDKRIAEEQNSSVTTAVKLKKDPTSDTDDKEKLHSETTIHQIPMPQREWDIGKSIDKDYEPVKEAGFKSYGHSRSGSYRKFHNLSEQNVFLRQDKSRNSCMDYRSDIPDRFKKGPVAPSMNKVGETHSFESHGKSLSYTRARGAAFRTTHSEKVHNSSFVQEVNTLSRQSFFPSEKKIKHETSSNAVENWIKSTSVVQNREKKANRNSVFYDNQKKQNEDNVFEGDFFHSGAYLNIKKTIGKNPSGWSSPPFADEMKNITHGCNVRSTNPVNKSSRFEHITSSYVDKTFDSTNFQSRRSCRIENRGSISVEINVEKQHAHAELPHINSNYNRGVYTETDANTDREKTRRNPKKTQMIYKPKHATLVSYSDQNALINSQDAATNVNGMSNERLDSFKRNGHPLEGQVQGTDTAIWSNLEDTKLEKLISATWSDNKDNAAEGDKNKNDFASCEITTTGRNCDGISNIDTIPDMSDTCTNVESILEMCSQPNVRDILSISDSWSKVENIHNASEDAWPSVDIIPDDSDTWPDAVSVPKASNAQSNVKEIQNTSGSWPKVASNAWPKFEATSSVSDKLGDFASVTGPEVKVVIDTTGACLKVEELSERCSSGSSKELINVSESSCAENPTLCLSLNDFSIAMMDDANKLDLNNSALGKADMILCATGKDTDKESEIETQLILAKNIAGGQTVEEPTGCSSSLLEHNFKHFLNNDSDVSDETIEAFESILKVSEKEKCLSNTNFEKFATLEMASSTSEILVSDDIDAIQTQNEPIDCEFKNIDELNDGSEDGSWDTISEHTDSD